MSLQAGNWNSDSRTWRSPSLTRKILVTRIRCELYVEFAARRVAHLLQMLNGETSRFELALNLRQIVRNHHEIDIHRVNRFDIAIYGQPPIKHHGLFRFSIVTTSAKSLAPPCVTDS